MRIGYPCINRSLAPGGRSGCTFRLASYSPPRFRDTVAANLTGLSEILQYNAAHGFLFFRITSQLVPFASHPVCRLRWWQEFAAEFRALGRQVREQAMRISLHPDQFTLLNAVNPDIVARSVAELRYHCRVLDAMELGPAAKVQIHVGGVYGDKPAALARFAAAYATLPEPIRRRLVIENDERHYGLADCLELHQQTGVPVLFDFFHHALNNRGESVAAAIRAAAGTWAPADGCLMTDYSSQEPGQRRGTHAATLDAAAFRRTLRASNPCNFDIMLEIKDKELSAARALALAAEHRVDQQERHPRAVVAVKMREEDHVDAVGVDTLRPHRDQRRRAAIEQEPRRRRRRRAGGRRRFHQDAGLKAAAAAEGIAGAEKAHGGGHGLKSSRMCTDTYDP